MRRAAVHGLGHDRLDGALGLVGVLEVDLCLGVAPGARAGALAVRDNIARRMRIVVIAAHDGACGQVALAVVREGNRYLVVVAVAGLVVRARARNLVHQIDVVARARAIRLRRLSIKVCLGEGHRAQATEVGEDAAVFHRVANARAFRIRAMLGRGPV